MNTTAPIPADPAAPVLRDVPPTKPTTVGSSPGRCSLTGRHVLVIGAGQNALGLDPSVTPPGIGRAISAVAATEGAAVACADLDRANAEETAASITQAGGTAVGIAGDASNPDDVQRMLAQARDELGGLDGLCLNVGVSIGGALEQTSLEQMRRAWEINVLSAFLGLQHGLPALDRGSSVVITSAIAAGRIGFAPMPYDLTKAALLPLMKHGARSGEALGVRVNMVLPGAIDTPLVRKFLQGPPNLGWGRGGSAWEVGRATAFLLSDDASYINATGLVVDGGLTAIH